MSLPKAQLVDPQGNMNLPGMTATGIVTASSLKGVTTGSATGLTGNPDLDVGIVTASSFVGQGDGHAANLTGTPQLNLGVTTSTGFVGDATGKAAGLTGTPNLNVGLITATSFVGFVTGGVTGNITGDVTGNITGNISGNVEGNVTGDVSGLAKGLGINGINVWTGAGTSNLGVGVCTALELHGDGSTLTGAGSTAYIAQEITATGYGGDTIIDLTYGNLIYYKGESKTTVGFASTSAAEQITFIRDTQPVTYDIDMDTAGVDFDAGDNITQTADAVLRNWFDQEFTVEYWIKADSLVSTDGGSSNVLGCSTLGSNSNFTWSFGPNGLGQVRFGFWTGSSETAILPSTTISTGTWYHLAFVHESDGTSKIFIDGVLGKEYKITNGAADGGTFNVGKVQTKNFDGKISNLRITHQALYSNDFIPPTGALTTTSQGALASNVKLLCCQSSTDDTAATVTPNTFSANGTPTPGAETITQSGSLTPSITWPDRIKWNNGVTPTLIQASESYAKAVQIFHFTTGDTGLTYTGWEQIEYDPGKPNTLFVWGDGGYGELAQNDRTSRSSPIQVPGNNWSTINTNNIGAASEIIAKKIDNTLWAWGRGAYGELGQNEGGAPAAKSSPVQIPGTTWALTNSGPIVVGSTKSDGTLWVWGWNGFGQLGLNDTTQRSSPTQIPGTTWPISTTGTDNVNMAMGYTPQIIKQNGTLWAWGNNENGSLGLNQGPSQLDMLSSPTQVGTQNTWKSVTDGMAKFTLATKTDGTLWAWGSDGSGALGQNGPVNRRLSSPTQVGTNTTWARVSQNNKDDFIGAVKTDGTLWMWAKGDRGVTGHNDLVWRSSPTQVGTDTNWKSIAIGDNHTIGVKTNGTLWGWGNNQGGELGLGSKAQENYSSPTQIPGTDWGSISVTANSTSIATQPYNG